MPKKSIDSLSPIIWFIDSSSIIWPEHTINPLKSYSSSAITLQDTLNMLYKTTGVLNTVELKYPQINYYEYSMRYESLKLKNKFLSTEMDFTLAHPNLSLDIYLNKALLKFKLHLSITHSSYVEINDNYYKNILIWGMSGVNYYASTLDLAALGMDIECLRVTSAPELVILTNKEIEHFNKNVLKNLKTSNTPYYSYLNMSFPRIFFDGLLQINVNKKTPLSRLVFDFSPKFIRLFEEIQKLITIKINYALNDTQNMLIYDINNKDGGFLSFDSTGFFKPSPFDFYSSELDFDLKRIS